VQLILGAVLLLSKLLLLLLLSKLLLLLLWSTPDSE
jgi:hypothetical protein